MGCCRDWMDVSLKQCTFMYDYVNTLECILFYKMLDAIETAGTYLFSGRWPEKSFTVVYFFPLELFVIELSQNTGSLMKFSK